MTTTTVYAEIVKAERNAAGDLVVVGKATGPDLDLDKQICDPGWLGKAMPEWFSTGGNIREQHSSIAAGVATELENVNDSWMVTATVVDPISAKKVEAKVLKGYSIGIAEPRVVKDAAAPGGRIVDGQIVEVSLVDRPCNPTALLSLAKAAKPGATMKAFAFDAERMLVKVEDFAEHADDGKTAEPDTGKRDFSADERREAADNGQAMPGGGFPVKNVSDLRNAIQAIGRAKDPAAARAHIKRRAAALGREDLIPDSWKTATADQGKASGSEEMAHDPGDIGAVRDGLVALIKAELDELMAGEDEICDVHELLCALQYLMCWWESEAAEGETVDPFPKGDDQHVITIPLSAEPDTPKTPEPAAAKTASGPDLTELVKQAVAEAMKDSQERVKALESELAKVSALPRPGGPVLTRTAGDTEKAAARDELAAEVAKYRALAGEITDPVARDGYLKLAAAAELKLK